MQYRDYQRSISDRIHAFERQANLHTPTAHQQRVRQATHKIENVAFRMKDGNRSFCPRDFPEWAVMFKEAIVALSDLLLYCDVSPPILPAFAKVAGRACPTSEFGLLDWLGDLVGAAEATAKAIEVNAPYIKNPRARYYDLLMFGSKDRAEAELDGKLVRWVEAGCDGKLEITTEGRTTAEVDAFVVKAVRAGFRCRLASRDRRLASGQLVRDPTQLLVVDRP
ncbi:hypothetical protein [Medusavirus stheno T3]|uniref:Uncharacterized protein n=1 Tax=Medusavirus stheno T3 TaxID=3069717 RepID=A0A7S7YFN3_9VIRU|nr:hypothetical protein QKU73_gp036 [Acanthamoeba castellanii medusavirus]QPB44217.1 hypothetical protein [Medusavirus stheno T3]